MKKIILLLLLSISAFAQVPQGISYQAIALNGSGNPVVSGNVGVRLTILDNAATGTAIYTETQTKTTNANGLFNLVIGQGTVVAGTFAGINWKTNLKFLKVELDAAGGTNYVLVGTTQLLSVPYALAAKSLVLAPGEGITLTSPNGTAYQLAVDNSGNLTLPTSGNSSALPDTFYLYGTFNSFNPATALLMYSVPNSFTAYKYFTAGTQIKFVSSNTANAAVYGFNGFGDIVLNGGAYSVPSNGLYFVGIDAYETYYGEVSQFIPKVLVSYTDQSAVDYNMSYNVATNTLSATINSVINSSKFSFILPRTGGSYYSLGDFTMDGVSDYDGTEISFPGASATTPKNYKIDFVMSFNGTGTYTVTQVP